jgi:hypothetical protein
MNRFLLASREKGESTMKPNRRWQVLCLTSAGGFLGIGCLSFDVFFASLPCFGIGLGLLIFGTRNWGKGQFWLASLGFGVIPTLLLLFNIFNDVLVPCSLPCVSRGSFIPPSYSMLLLCFASIALLSGIWPFFRLKSRAFGSD